MFDNRKETYTIKDIFLQLLFIVLFVFILIWLFPTKGYLENKLSNQNNDALKPLYTRLFTDNILTMKEAAKNYYTTPRLPQNVGDKVKMTLAQMYEKGLLLELIDSNNNACDTTKSYIELTKMEDEYQLKTVLSCSDKEAFVIEYLGCYDYCNGRLCSKAEENLSPVKNYRYQYVLQTGGTCGEFGSWSDWTSNVIEASDNVKVDTKTEKVFDRYEQVYGVVDTKYVDEKYSEDVTFGYSTRTIKKTTTYNYTTKTITSVVPYEEKTTDTTTTIPYSTKTIKKTTTYNYTTKNTTTVVPYAEKTTTTDVIVGYSTRTIKKTTTYAYSYKNVVSSTEWVAAGRIETTEPQSNTDTIHYNFVSSRKELSCNDECTITNYYTYDVEKIKYNYTKQAYCPQGEDTGSGCKVVTYETQNYCSVGTDNGNGCLVKANQTVLYCTEGVDNGSGCAITTSEKYCANGTDIGTGCQVVTYTTQNYCAQGTDNGSSCTINANQTVKYCPNGTDTGSGCAITTSEKYCANGIDTGSNCQVVTYIKQNYCAMGEDTGSGCKATIEKTRKVEQLIYGYKDGEAIYKNVTYYRSKSRICSGGTVDYKWSNSMNDTELKSKGYTLTGYKEEVK